MTDSGYEFDEVGIITIKARRNIWRMDQTVDRLDRLV